MSVKWKIYYQMDGRDHETILLASSAEEAVKLLKGLNRGKNIMVYSVERFRF